MSPNATGTISPLSVQPVILHQAQFNIHSMEKKHTACGIFQWPDSTWISAIQCLVQGNKCLGSSKTLSTKPSGKAHMSNSLSFALGIAIQCGSRWGKISFPNEKQHIQVRTADTVLLQNRRIMIKSLIFKTSRSESDDSNFVWVKADQLSVENGWMSQSLWTTIILCSWKELLCAVHQINLTWMISQFQLGHRVILPQHPFHNHVLQLEAHYHITNWVFPFPNRNFPHWATHTLWSTPATVGWKRIS